MNHFLYWYFKFYRCKFILSEKKNHTDPARLKKHFNDQVVYYTAFMTCRPLHLSLSMYHQVFHEI